MNFLKQPKSKKAADDAASSKAEFTFTGAWSSIGFGLPEYLLEYEDGVPRVRKLLNMNGNQLNGFLAAAPTKKRLKYCDQVFYSKNDKLVYLLGDPELRVIEASVALEDLQAKTFKYFKSIEIEILKKFEPDFLGVEFDEQKLRECAPEIADLIPSDAELNKRIAMQWVRFVSVLSNWQSLTWEERRDLGLVAFALSTLMQTGHAVSYVLRLEPGLEEFIGFMSVDSGDADFTEEAEDDPELEGNQFMIKTWDGALEAIADVSVEAHGTPSLEVVEKLQALVNSAREFATQDRESLESKKSIEGKLELFSEELVCFASRVGLEWLAYSRDEILTAWRAAVETDDTWLATLDMVMEEAEMVAEVLATLRDERSSLLKESGALEDSMPEKAVERMKAMKKLSELSEKISLKTSAISSAELEILSVLMPEQDGDLEAGSEGIVRGEDVAAAVTQGQPSLEGTDQPEAVAQPCDAGQQDGAEAGEPESLEMVAAGAVEPLEDAPDFPLIASPIEDCADEPVEELSADATSDIQEIATDALSEPQVLVETGSDRSEPEPSEVADGGNAYELVDILGTGPEPTDDLGHAVAVSPAAAPGPVEEQTDHTPLLASLINERDLEWAYWLTVALGDRSPVPAWVMEIAELGIQFQPMFRNSEDRLRQLFIDNAAQLDGISKDAALILGASLLRPMLMAPHTYPMFFMEETSEMLHRLPSFNLLARSLCDFAKKGIPLGDDLLQGLTSMDFWETELAALEAQTEEFLDGAPKWTVKLHKATKVWEKWLGANGDLRSLLVDSRSFSRKREEIESQLAEWRSETLFERKMDATSREVSKPPHGEPIRFGAKDTLRRYSEECLQLAERWLTYHMKQPKGTNDSYGFKELKELASVAEMVASALPAIGEDSRPLTCAGISLMRMMLDELAKSFKNGVVTRDTDPFSVRESELLLLPTIAVRDRELYGNDLFLEAVLNHLGRPLELDASFRKHLELGHIALAARMFSMLPEQSQAAERENLEEGRKNWIKRVEKAIRDLSEDMMGRLLKGAITETDQNSWEDTLARLGRELKECPDEPYRALAAVDRVRHEVDEASVKGIATVREKMSVLAKSLAKQGHTIAPEIVQRFEAIAANGDLSVANDILVRLETAPEAPELGDIFVDKVSHNSFENFLAAVGSIFEHCADFRRAQRDLQISSRWLDSPEPFDEIQRKNVLDATGWWNSIVASTGNNFNQKHYPDLYRLLRWFGFQIEASVNLVEIERHGSPNFWKHYRFSGAIESPIPLFGSQANRNHHLVLVWRDLDAASFAQWLKGSAKVTAGEAITFIYFNRLDALSRRKAVHSIRKAGFAPILIDACLMAWLGNFSGSARTAELFGVCLPGGRTNPYTPEVAGSVPMEMYFGRQDNIDDLWRDGGPCLVFGGRQLGKSALLQQVKRRFHDPANERYVLYHGKFSTDLMDLIRRLMVNEGLLTDRGLGHEEKVKAAILKMLEDRPNCKIRILLDESDHLIEEDSKQRFRQLSLVRDLMTESNRRFKVVLAGLHSVQRFQRIPNQPLAHFGAPLCIGPLNPKDAENLVLQPLHALGFHFDPPSLVQRVLAYTNFHPSLIQLFCHDLVEAVQVSQRYAMEKTPPFVIDETTINQVFNKANLAKKMRDRFDWTLDLDKRYRVIGYTIAFLDLMGEVPVEGLRAVDMLGQTRDFWPQGFAETDIDEMLGLLDEMVGLGLLIRTSIKGYRLRSHNVLRLLGSAQEITDELERFIDEPFDHPADPQVVRRILDSASGKASPLTILQENLLLQRRSGVDLVVGAPAHSVDDVGYSLGHLIREKAASREKEPSFDVIDTAEGIASIVPALKAIFTKGKLSQSFRVIVTRRESPVPVYVKAIQEAASYILGLKHEVRYFRVVFIVDPESLFALNGQGVMDELDKLDQVTIHRLRRWRIAGIGHWFHDVERISSKEVVSEWFQNSGGWPCLLADEQKRLLGGTQVEIQDDQQGVALWKSLGLDLVPQVYSVAKLLADFDDGQPMLKNDIVEFLEGRLSLDQTEIALRCLLDLDAAVGSSECLRLEKRLSRALCAGA